MSMSILILININIMGMKNHMLIFIFMFMLVGKERSEIVIMIRYLISYILKQQWCLFVCVGSAKRPGQSLRGPREVPFLLKKSLGKIGGPASNQTKIQIF
jgi:hypothetical protein